MDTSAVNRACDALTAAITTIIRTRNEILAREVVPELDSVRSLLMRLGSDRVIRLEDVAERRADRSSA